MAKFMLGSYRHQMDDKNRVVVPAKFREGLGATPYIVTGRDGCMYLVPENNFDTLLGKYASPDLYDTQLQDFATSIFSYSGELELDDVGRMRIDKSLKSLAGFENEIVFVGKASFVEMWPAKVWDDKFGILNPERLGKMIADLKNRGV